MLKQEIDIYTQAVNDSFLKHSELLPEHRGFP